MGKLLISLFICLFASACIAVQPDLIHKSNRDVTTVHMRWMKSFIEVNNACNKYVSMPMLSILGCTVFDGYDGSITIIAVEPDDFNDHTKLEILGHEFWHALGAKHK